MSSWTADIECHGDAATQEGIKQWTSTLTQAGAGIRLVDDTAAITATVTVEAPSIAEALRLVGSVIDDESWVRRISEVAFELNPLPGTASIST